MEPLPGRVRPIGMVPRLAAVAMTGLLLSGAAAGCGQRPDPASGSEPASKAAGVGSCAADSFQVTHAKPVDTAVDLNHDGLGDDVRVTDPDAQGCPNTLFAKIAHGYVSMPLGDVMLDPGTAGRVIVPGTKGDLVAIRQTHPRGGFQVRLYGFDGSRLGEVTSAGNPVVPFVATDTRGSFVSASCADDAIVVRQAIEHTPTGGSPTWDIRDTSYRLDGLEASRGDARVVKAGVADSRLAEAYPEVTGREMFKVGCRG